jgi:hypothetical protein
VTRSSFGVARLLGRLIELAGILGCRQRFNNLMTNPAGDGETATCETKQEAIGIEWTKLHPSRILLLLNVIRAVSRLSENLRLILHPSSFLARLLASPVQRDV